ncbi:MAG: TnpV protein [Oscillospiraceae bacterium]|nr:TnpV protein [Oscillospiraceae bacterium]MBP5744643.1 TnpV protein [Oscillospiraceae bacterium]
MKLTYHWEGEYLFPDLVQPESPQIGIWGERRRQFLRTHQRPMYDAMLMNGTLNAHLKEIDQTASEMAERLTTQLAERENVTESLKAEDQMAWVQAMNSIRNCAEEIIRHNLIEQ